MTKDVLSATIDHVLLCCFFNVCAVTDSGQTPMDIADEEGNEECLQLVSGTCFLPRKKFKKGALDH